RGMAMAIYGLGVVVAPVIGPTLGGWITDNYSWRWVFYINVPVGIIALLMMNRFLEDPPYIKNARPGRIDAIGFGLMALGLATLPTGIGARIGMPFVGLLISKIDSRALIVAGFSLVAVTCFILGNLTLDITGTHFVLPTVMQGVALGLIFVPLTTVALGTLNNEQIGNATGIFSLVRNIGASVGISLVTTAISRNAQTHQTTLAAHFTP